MQSVSYNLLVITGLENDLSPHPFSSFKTLFSAISSHDADHQLGLRTGSSHILPCNYGLV